MEMNETEDIVNIDCSAKHYADSPNQKNKNKPLWK